MGKVPVLKPRQIVRILENLVLNRSGNGDRTAKFDTRTDGLQLFRITKEGIFPRSCFERSRTTYV